MIDQLLAIASEYANIRFYRMTEKGIEQSWTLNNDPILEAPGAIII